MILAVIAVDETQMRAIKQNLSVNYLAYFYQPQIMMFNYSIQMRAVEQYFQVGLFSRFLASEYFFHPGIS